MGKKLCIVHANCQGAPIVDRLMACPDFYARYEVRLFTNYTREPIPPSLLSSCDLFLYQYLGMEWGDVSSQTLLGVLPDSAESLCIPNMFFSGYWPFWSGRKGFNYRCTILDECIAKGLPAEETILLFLRADVTKQYDLLGRVAQTLDQERQREAHTPIKYLDFIIANYRDERIFNTVNHPGRKLVNRVAADILMYLGHSVPEPSLFDALGEPFPEFEQPIDPRVGAYFGWDFAKADTLYEIYGRKLSHIRYVANYVAAQLDGVSDFIGYLQGEYVVI